MHFDDDYDVEYERVAYFQNSFDTVDFISPVSKVSDDVSETSVKEQQRKPQHRRINFVDSWLFNNFRLEINLRFFKGLDLFFFFKIQ